MSTQALASDNLIGVQLVTADGEVLSVTDGFASRPDVGAARWGRQLGVAASLEYGCGDSRWWSAV